jgi:hypothetical protein
MNTKKEQVSTKLSLVPMLLTGESISPEARQALRENRLKDAAEILMKDYGLSCVEAGRFWTFPRAKGQLIRREHRFQEGGLTWTYN